MGAAAALLEDETGGVVFVWGNATFSWEASDPAGRRFAAVQLVVTKTAKAAQVARAFEISTSTLFRWCSDFSAHGLSGLLLAATLSVHRSAALDDDGPAAFDGDGAHVSPG